MKSRINAGYVEGSIVGVERVVVITVPGQSVTEDYQRFDQCNVVSPEDGLGSADLSLGHADRRFIFTCLDLVFRYLQRLVGFIHVVCRRRIDRLHRGFRDSGVASDCTDRVHQGGGKDP